MTGTNQATHSHLSNEEIERLLASPESWSNEELALIEDYVGSEPVHAIPLLAFGLKYFSHHFTNVTPDFHLELVADLEALKPGESLSRIAPRGGAKSTWTTLIYPIYKAVYRQKRYIIVIGDIQPNSNLFLSHIANEFDDNEKLRADFPECRPGGTWRAEAIELSNGVRIEAMSYGKGKIRGRRAFGHVRPDLIIIDDPQNSEDAASPDQLAKDKQWLKSDVLNAGGPDTNYILVGTALVDGCLVLEVRKDLPTWSHKTYKSLISPPVNLHLWEKWKEILWQHDNPNKAVDARKWYEQHRSGEGGMDFGTQVLWPDRVPLYDLMLKRFSQGERAFASEHQGEPMPPGNAEFNAEYFEYNDTFWFDEWPQDITLRTMGCDPSKGMDSREGDYQAIVRLARDRAGVMYVEAFLDKMDVKVWCDFIVKVYTDWPVNAIGFEENGFQSVLFYPLATAAKAKDIHLKLPVVPITNTINKAVRILDLTSPLCQRLIRFRRNSPGTVLLVDQLKKFRRTLPKGQHDDGPDAMQMALQTAWMYDQSK